MTSTNGYTTLMETTILEGIAEVAAAEWNALVQAHHPFLKHEFLSALERNRCVGEGTGWVPNHIVVRDHGGRLRGAVPLYLKDDSWGEFVFDWGWAEAWHRHGIPYYPKLVSAVPFTPATGQRLLVMPGDHCQELRQRLVADLIDHAGTTGVSSLHCLFPVPEDLQLLRDNGLAGRTGCQFHWRNSGYAGFADFLARLSSKKRKNIQRERRRVCETGLAIERAAGDQLSEAQWSQVHELYRFGYERRGGHASLTLPFFLEIAATMGDQILLILARDGQRIVAVAILLTSAEALYGRYWGCAGRYDGLHFELCYYQGIEYCIEQNLELFEPGAQGEHKLSRGFVPVLTQSAHWIADDGFRSAVQDFLTREDLAVRRYAAAMSAHSPYRERGQEGGGGRTA